MNDIEKKHITSLIVWGLRVILFSVLAYALYDFGADVGPSILGSIMFMVFWLWCFWIDYEENPVIRNDKND